MNEEEVEVTSPDANPDALEAALGDDLFIDELDEDFIKRVKDGEDDDEDGPLFAYNDSNDNYFDQI